jgi:hypothetical protein
MRLFDVMSVFVVAIGSLVGGVIALLEPNWSISISIGLFLSLATTAVRLHIDYNYLVNLTLFL